METVIGNHYIDVQRRLIELERENQRLRFLLLHANTGLGTPEGLTQSHNSRDRTDPTQPDQNTRETSPDDNTSDARPRGTVDVERTQPSLTPAPTQCTDSSVRDLHPETQNSSENAPGPGNVTTHSCETKCVDTEATETRNTENVSGPILESQNVGGLVHETKDLSEPGAVARQVPDNISFEKLPHEATPLTRTSEGAVCKVKHQSLATENVYRARDPAAVQQMLDVIVGKTQENERLCMEKERLETQLQWANDRIGQMVTTIAALCGERDALAVRSSQLENDLNDLEQRAQSQVVEFQKEREAMKDKAITVYEEWTGRLEEIKICQHSLLHQLRTLQDGAVSSHELNKIEVIDGDAEKRKECISDQAVVGSDSPSLSLASSPSTKSFKTFPVTHWANCKLCLQLYNPDVDTEDCYYHPSRPLNFNEWRHILPHEANEGMRRYKLYYCCWKLTNKRPGGCIGPRSHTPSTAD